MSDIFENLNEKIQKSSEKGDNSGSASKDSTAEAKNSSEKTKKPQSTEKTTDSRNKTADKPKESSRKSDRPSSDAALDKLAKIISTGFSELKDLYQENASQSREYDEFEEEIDDFPEELVTVTDNDMFDDLSLQINDGEKVGDEVRPSLAALTDKLLQMKVGDDLFKEKREKFLRPKNIQFLSTPKINKPIWENLSSSTRIKESQLQTIQKDFLASAVPIVHVMEKIFTNKENFSLLMQKTLSTP